MILQRVVAKWTGIPVTKMIQSERDKLLHFRKTITQKSGWSRRSYCMLVSDAVRRSRAGLQNP
jgi:ATP-dependent Clp protease ATP-binding subunit ClpB